MAKIGIFGVEGRSNNRLMFDILAGVGLGLAFILLNSISADFFIIGSVPDFALGLDDTVRSTVSVVLAPVVEEIAFRGALLAVLVTIVGLPFLVGAIISSLVFAVYHINAYAGSLASTGAVTGALFGAFTFGMIISLLLVRKNWRNLTTAIIAHAMFNFFLLTKLVVAT